jgi:hydrogenase expression/formation protein HypC
MMCLAVPAKVVRIDGDFAIVQFEGMEKQVCVALIDDITKDDYVIVHAGFAISKVDLEEARKTLELFQRLSDETS